MTVAKEPQRDARPKSSKVIQPPPAVESALSQALAMVAVALDTQPATSAPPVAVVSTHAATEAPEQHPLELFMRDSDSESEHAETPAVAPVAAPPAPPPPDPFAGHWVFDQQLGWLWLPANTSSVVIVPVIEVFPSGLITIRAGAKPAATRSLPKNTARSLPSPSPINSVIQHDAPGSRPSPAWLPSSPKK